ncbi:MAG TPA: lysophospholipid acyltransferase family protein [Sphingomonas sp.]|jgi:1-acyl-sn-glycerol-3-phosphate acyltransferase|uniref:lysophospholipid acyltransferase family protein n=1 Tax=Sphingomonas sp. TaxID=28214 RepID=UPI002EDB093C
MAVVRSILFMIAFAPGSVGAVLLALLAAPFGTPPVLKVSRGWAYYHRWCARWLLGIRVRIEGVIPNEPVLVAAKHESMFETLELIILLPDPAVVVKKELADIPGWGRAARAHGVIPVDRDGSATALRIMMRAAKAALAAGRSIVIFPEGTRTAPGVRAPLRPGFAGLYRTLGLPVVPVALDSGRVYPRRGFVKRAGVVTFRFGPPIPPGLRRAEIEAQVLDAINAFNPPAA